MRCQILAFLFITVVTPVVYAQTNVGPPLRIPPRTPSIAPSRARSRPPILPGAWEDDSDLERSAEQITDARPDVNNKTLVNDAEAVEASWPAVLFTLKQRGFTNSEAEQAILEGWRRLRIKELDASVVLSPKRLIDYVLGFVKLTIVSTPTGASVEIDGELEQDKTENVSFASPGVYRIRLTLEGYESIEDTCTVKEGQPITFTRTLKKIEKKK